jgi:dolichol-phosphate mannosyltransferase
MRISIVVPAFNEEEGITDFLTVLRSVIESQNHNFEVLIINDGSTDHTREKIQEFNWDKVKTVNLLSNSGHMAAIEAGLNVASGEFVITMDADLQHPPQVILEMIEIHFNSLADVVIGVRIRGNEEGFLRRTMAKGFYKGLSKISDTQIEPDAGDFRLMTREVVNQLITLPENNKVFRFLVSSLGYRVAKVEFISPKRELGESKYKLSDLIKLATTSVIGFSTAPLTAIFIGGISFALVSLLYMAFVFFNFANQAVVPGWTSVMIVVLSLSAIQMVSLGIIGRYISQILNEIRKRPNYLVRNIDPE